MSDEVKTESNGVNGEVHAEKRPAPAESAENGNAPDLKKPKTELSPPSDVEKQIIQQIEYYFGDINLPRDKFLIEEMKKDNQWVSIETLLKFNRLKKICDDQVKISDALRKSTAGLIEVAPTNDKVRRCVEMPENSLEFWKGIKQRSVYVKGFPHDADLDSIQQCLAKFGQLEQVLMRRVKSTDPESRIFKGSVFATFKTIDECKNLVKEEKVLYKEIELLREMQEDYMARKQKESQEARRQVKEEKRNRRLTNLSFKPGCLLKVTGVPKEGEQWKDLKDLFMEHSKVLHVAHEAGQDTATVRFDQEGVAKTVLDKLTDGQVDFKEHKLTGSVVEGEEEKDFYLEYDKMKREKEEEKRRQIRQKQDERKKNHRTRQRDNRNKRSGDAASGGQVEEKGKKKMFADSSDEEGGDGDDSKDKPESNDVPATDKKEDTKAEETAT